METTSTPTTLAYAKQVFSRGTDAFGPDDLGRAFGLKPEVDPLIVFPREELARARELD